MKFAQRRFEQHNSSTAGFGSAYPLVSGPAWGLENYTIS
jgi:hypothetical protein